MVVEKEVVELEREIANISGHLETAVEHSRILCIVTAGTSRHTAAARLDAQLRMLHLMFSSVSLFHIQNS